MFDIGFWELCLIAVVALLILGPERLPTAARTAGLWIGKARRMVGNVKSEIDRELQLDEVRKRLKEEELRLRENTGISDLESMSDNTIAGIQNIQTDIEAAANNNPPQTDSSPDNGATKADNPPNKT